MEKRTACKECKNYKFGIAQDRLSKCLASPKPKSFDWWSGEENLVAYNHPMNINNGYCVLFESKD